MFELTINGEVQRLAQSLTIAQLLRERGLEGKRVAVERNGRIVPKSRHEAENVAAGDRVEIVVAVGGG